MLTNYITIPKEPSPLCTLHKFHSASQHHELDLCCGESVVFIHDELLSFLVSIGELKFVSCDSLVKIQNILCCGLEMACSIVGF